jgi:hypothetical protein
VGRAAALLAAVVGQDLDEGADGVFRIARRVAKDRIISTVDPDARHGHKTAARGFDGYKGHVAVDPDSELITATTVTAGNVGDAAPAADLLADDLPDPGPAADPEPAADAEPEPGAGVEGQRLVVCVKLGDCNTATTGTADLLAKSLNDVILRAGIRCLNGERRPAAESLAYVLSGVSSLDL